MLSARRAPGHGTETVTPLSAWTSVEHPQNGSLRQSGSYIGVQMGCDQQQLWVVLNLVCPSNRLADNHLLSPQEASLHYPSGVRTREMWIKIPPGPFASSVQITSQWSFHFLSFEIGLIIFTSLSPYKATNEIMPASPKPYSTILKLWYLYVSLFKTHKIHYYTKGYRKLCKNLFNPGLDHETQHLCTAGWEVGSSGPAEQHILLAGCLFPQTLPLWRARYTETVWN